MTLEPARVHSGEERRSVIWRRIKLVFPYALLFAGTVGLIVSIWNAVDTRMRAEEANAVVRASERAESGARSFEQFALRTLKAADDVTRMAALTMQRTGATDMIRLVEQAQIIDDQVLQSLSVIGERGNLIASTSPGLASFNHASQKYFREAQLGKSDAIIFGAPVGSRLTDQATVPVVRRFLKLDGSFGGIVLVQIKAKAFAGGYEAFRLRDKDYAALIGFDGVARVGSVGSHPIAGQEFSQSKLIERQKEVASGVFLDKGAEAKSAHFVAYRTLAEYPLVVAFGVDFGFYADDVAKKQEELSTIRNKGSVLIALFSLMLGLVLFRKDQANDDLQSKEAKLRAVSTSDVLTGLPNRAAIEATQEIELRRAEVIGFEVACLFIEVDGLCAVNASLGHSIGDEALKAVARAMAPIIEPIGQVARIAGDEFVAVFRVAGDPEEHALSVAEEIKQAVEKLNFVEGQLIDVRANIGVSLFPRHANTFNDLIRCADAAMASSKLEHSGAPHVFIPDMHIAIAKRLAIRAELAQAIESDQLEVFYLPMLDLANERPVGMEALVRWRHPARGLMSPNDFIQIAEESGLMIQIGAWVLKQACRDCKKLMRSGYAHFSVAVNVSPLQFRQADLVESVRAALKDAKLPASRLELEITESMVADKPELVVGRLEHLKKLGVTIALDDFGTGYSNLQYLQRFPIDALKVDRSFVSGAPNDEHSKSVVLAIIGLAKSLGLKVVAEGVETVEQQEFLLANNCDVGQGFLYGKPMPFNDFKNWLRTQVKPENAPEDVVVAFPLDRGAA